MVSELKLPIPRVGPEQIIPVERRALIHMGLQGLVRLMHNLGLDTEDVEEAEDALRAIEMNRVG